MSLRAQKRSLRSMGRSLRGGKAGGKPWQERLLEREQEPSQMWWRYEVTDDGETSLSFSTDTFTENLSWGRLASQVAGSGVQWLQE